MYLGNQPALSYTSFAKQDFTTSATTSYTLDHPVTNANELALFINFVRQEPTTAYTASGTTLTLTSATSASDDMYCVFLGKAVQTVNPPSGSVGASQLVDGSIALGKLSATGTKDATTFLRGDNTFASAGGVNTPAFQAGRITSGQSITPYTSTTIIFNGERFDTNSCYDTSTGIFTPTTSGKYFVYSLTTYQALTSSTYVEINIVKNSSQSISLSRSSNPTTYPSFYNYCFVDMNGSTDNIRIKTYHEDSANKNIYAENGDLGDGRASFFGAYKIIE